MPASRSPVAAGLLAALTAVAALAGCSNDQAPAAKGPHAGTGSAVNQGGLQVVTVTTGDDYRFHPSTLVVHPGRVRVVLKNTAKQGAPHNLRLDDFPADFVPLAGAGHTTAATFTAPAPGRYRFVCTIHERQGQTGVLVVRP
ncbi:Plastocyanin [Jatrophihabitans endophyticus]|uniref:Plastocyanin n=1 Tax=Jatrophihabitans endophyticus TaxID=1206085 RepID=A0A1M5H336_9ACTN|nr:cupredoxin domain-containing protein [Jatrophihabitans endophyticus]SHG10441.1 Plastocyanin [Jatrophihabitans endophyticus]